MNEPITLVNDVPMLERLVALLFLVVGAPLTYLVWTESGELPDILVPVVSVGLPILVLVVVWRAFMHRHRVRVTLYPGDSSVRVEERLLFSVRRSTVTVESAELEIGEDIDGDPYGSLVLHLAAGTDLVAAEGTDIEMLRRRLLEVQQWLRRV